MSTLLLRLCGPLQSWGIESQMVQRHTQDVPTKSGVVGLLACALGIDRNDPANPHRIAPLARLRMGVRVLKAGAVLSDYQTATDVRRYSGGVQTALIQRHYLQDADFLVGLEGDPILLAHCQAAVRRPHWPLVLGRRNCPPALPVWIPDDPAYGGPGIRAQALRTALLGWSWVEGDAMALCVYDDPDGDEETMDTPVSFMPGQTRYAPRRFQRVWEPRPAEVHQ